MTEVNQQKANRRKSHLPFRLNLFFFIIFLLFSLLMFRLWDLQVIKGQIYTQTLSSTKNCTNTAQCPARQTIGCQRQTVGWQYC